MNIRAFAANMGFKVTPLSNGFQRDHWSQKSMFINSCVLTNQFLIAFFCDYFALLLTIFLVADTKVHDLLKPLPSL